jgi:hypothetical protein
MIARILVNVSHVLRIRPASSQHDVFFLECEELTKWVCA